MPKVPNDVNAQRLEVVVQENGFKRLDQFLAHHWPEIGRTALKKYFLAGRITSPNFSHLELNKMPPENTIIHVDLPPVIDSHHRPEDIPLEILFEDSHLLIINKPPGLVTHPAPGNHQGTLVNALLHHCHDLAGIGDERRPGIVHRLDKGTSGVMVVAKTNQCHQQLVQLFAGHHLTRKYQTLIWPNQLPPAGTIRTFYGRHLQQRLKMTSKLASGKIAITHYRVLRPVGPLLLLELTLETGRTHQIRVHLAEVLQAPILNDPLYGRAQQDLLRLQPFPLAHQILAHYPFPLLHAHILEFTHPITGSPLRFNLPPAGAFRQLLEVPW